MLVGIRARVRVSTAAPTCADVEGWLQDVKEYQTVQWRNGPCYNTTAYVSRAISPAFASYYSLKSVGTAALNYTDGRDPRFGHALWLRLCLARLCDANPLP